MSARFLPLLALVLGAITVGLLAAPPRALGRADAPPLLPRIEVIRALGAGYLHLVTDYFWVQTLQAISLANSPASYRNIYDYAELVSELDPPFRAVYVFAGTSIPYRVGPSQYANTEESTRILEKGLKQAPDHLMLNILLAYNLLMFHQEYERAAEILQDAAELPGAPRYLKSLATRLYSEAGDFDAGLALTRSLIEESSDPETREAFELRYRELLLERILTKVDEAIAEYQTRTGSEPASVAALVSAGLLSSVPEDPLGGEIVIEGGEARSTESEKRLRIHKPDFEVPENAR